MIINRFRLFIVLVIALAFSQLTGGLSPQTRVVEAASMTVTTSSQAIADDGLCSLNEAIILANNDTDPLTQFGFSSAGECVAGSGDDVITLNLSIVLTAAEPTSTNIYDGQAGLPDITSNITIQSGIGSTLMRVSIVNNFRILYVTASGNLTLNGLTVRGGHVTGGGSSSGGGILNQGTLTLNNSTIRNNRLTGSFPKGGGIFNAGGNVTINNSQITSNHIEGTATAASGGGIYSDGGTLTINNSWIDNNEALSNDFACSLYCGGGGIYAYVSTVVINNSTVSDNVATNSQNSIVAGGGIRGAGGNLTISGSTISDNIVSGSTNRGGGLYSDDTLTTITSSTIIGNSASEGGGIYHSSNTGVALNLRNSTVAINFSSGTGGLYNTGGNAPATVYSSILANNGVDCTFITSAVTSSGYNLVQNPGNCVFAGAGDQTGIDPQLGGLVNNGGPTSTIALSSTSPALDAGSCTTSGVTTDQRGSGYPRPVDLSGFADAGDGCDSGAYEMQGYPIIIVKDDTIDSGTEFAFNSNIPSFGAFLLDDDGDTDPFFDDSIEFELVAGTYTVTEALTPGWSLTGLVCSDPDMGTTTNVGTRQATIDLDAGEAITCTFTNEPLATLSASAVCVNENLDVTISGGDGPFDISASAGINTPVLGVGIGTTTINGPEKWDNVTVTESGGDLESINVGTFKCRTDEKPTLVSPAHQTHTTNPFPQFSWTAITDANNYRLWVFDDASPATRTVDIRQNSGGATSLTLNTTLPNGRLFWRVRGRQNRVWGLWSSRFTLFKDPPVLFDVPAAEPTIASQPTVVPVPTDHPSSDGSAPPERDRPPTLPAPPNSR